MSHFTVLVIGDNAETQLEPFDENIRMAKHVEHTKKELIKRGKKDIKAYEKGYYADYLKDPKKYELEFTNKGHLDYVKNEFPKKLKWTDAQIYKDQIRWYEKEDIGKDGEVYTTRNPKSKWDWYSLGGRWMGYFKSKEGVKFQLGVSDMGDNKPEAGYADAIKKGDVDWDGMRLDSFHKTEKNWREYEKALKTGKLKGNDAYWRYGIEKKETKKDYLARQCSIATYAVLKDGEWFQKGQMGMFGMGHHEMSEKKWIESFDKMINSLSEDTLLSLYDCHI